MLGDSFEKYLETVKRMLSQAMHLSVMQVGTSNAEKNSAQDQEPPAPQLSSVGSERAGPLRVSVKHI